MSNKFFIKYNSVICYNTVDNFHFSYTLIVQKNLFIIKGENMKKILPILVIILLVISCSSVEPKNENFSGKASWYGSEFEGSSTASGETFSSNKLTAAHRSLPFGSIIEVTNIKNDKKVKVKINDRGPFKGGRILDLSEEAFSRIANINEGVIEVKVRVLKSGDVN